MRREDVPSTNAAHAIIAHIARRNAEIARVWCAVQGWAPAEAAGLLSRARLDWQVSLSDTLALWYEHRVPPTHPRAHGQRILAWANLGALVEGTMRWFACVYYADYQRDANVLRRGPAQSVDGPDTLMLDRLRVFFKQSVWTAADDADAWVLMVQQRRNAIHAFKDRTLGTDQEFDAAVLRYAALLDDLASRVAWPDGDRTH